ncbi:hypothetical protein EAH89_10895 [Roseomonas nepalensis]|uniref:DUF2933 domain-containing protein n=1 Tax=Muricoccus nepalensis TaxID=1854500 RepID=A0A502G758_9PROT|nr:hypothetical protein [Roseomonas nepalensis]TPG57431.1 hypothetical protein EAH89_10895 [Roseomonas nepalensis]
MQHSKRLQRMNISAPSRDLALTTHIPGDEYTQAPRLSATWASTRRIFQGRRGLLVLAAGLAVTGLLAGWNWLGTAAILPLLYTLPCAAMMAMCMRGHGGSNRSAPVEADAPANLNIGLPR